MHITGLAQGTTRTGRENGFRLKFLTNHDGGSMILKID